MSRQFPALAQFVDPADHIHDPIGHEHVFTDLPGSPFDAAGNMTMSGHILFDADAVHNIADATNSVASFFLYTLYDETGTERWDLNGDLQPAGTGTNFGHAFLSLGDYGVLGSSGSWVTASLATHANLPDDPVDIRVHGQCWVLLNAAAEQVQFRVGVSIDGGSAWTYGPETRASVGNAAGSSVRQALSAFVGKAGGASSTSIQARLQIKSSGTASDWNALGVMFDWHPS